MTNLQPKQFVLHRQGGDVLDDWDDTPRATTSNYSLARPYVDEDGYEDGYSDVHGRVEVHHNPAGPISIQNWNQPMWGEPFKQPPARGTFNMSTGRETDGQQELFREAYNTNNPGKSVVEGMYFTKTARAMALPVLAVAARDAAERGQPLIASGDRSEHSERLTQRLGAAGVPGATERTNSNGIGFAPASSRPTSVLGDAMPPEALQRGRSASRAIVRGARRRKPPVQETLF